MRGARASRTAEFMALFRALESGRPAGARLFTDPLARAFLPARLRCVVGLARVPLVGRAVPWVIDRRWPGPRGAGVCRTRFIDDVLGDALADGIRQVVILGAGFDSRAYRLAVLDRVRVFEVDHPATQARKRERLRALLGELPAHVVFVPVDFDHEDLGAALAGAGYREAAPALFIWEGVTNYLGAAAVDATLRYVARGAPGSRIVLTYVHRGIVDGSAHFAGARESMATVRRVGEPFTFGFDPAELPAYLAARGLTLLEDVGAPEYRARYLRPAGRDMPLSEFYRAAIARVGGAPAKDAG